MELLLIRHAHTASNASHALDTERPGPPLTDLGQAQAAALAHQLRNVPIDAVYASTLVRAQQTAAPLAMSQGHEVRVRDGLREVAAGEYEMRTDKEAMRAYLKVIFGWCRSDFTGAIANGEDGRAMLARFDAVIEEMQVGGHRRVAVVSHGCAIRVWTAARAADLSVDHAARTALRNTGIITLTGASGRWRMVDWSDEAVGPNLATEGGRSGPAGQAL